MYAPQILLFLLINFFHVFLGCGYLSLPALRRRRKGLLLTAWAALWLALNLLCSYVLTGISAVRILSAAMIALVLFFSAVALCLYSKMQRKTEVKLQDALYNRQLEYYSRQYQEISRSQQEIRRMRHELKNNYILLETFAKNGDIDSILTYLPQMYQTEPDRLTARTGNMVVDSVINHRIAQTDSIRFQLCLNIPTQLDISDIRLSGLLGNALDNAVEAALRVPEKDRCIRISMEIEKKNLFIEISNPYDGTILSDGKGRLLTRKENISRHGYGLSVMKEMLGSNQGSMETEWDGSIFRLRIILYSVI